MSEPIFHQQKHGYRNGHQLLQSTVRLDRADQDVIDRLSDLSGQIRPSEVIPTYLTIYPLPSRAYQVVARTWQDLAAPRAGCVLTKSLLVPQTRWAEHPALSGLLEQLEIPAIGEPAVLAGEEDARPFPPSDDPRTPELVEALFLELRKPIVFFGAADAELLAVRLVTAFWPAFRSEFSLCTYALGPRKVTGRDFDLVFAPKDARSRFSAWSGRKIEAGTPKSARHRWSSIVADAIFQSPHPTLASGDALGLLGNGGPGDEAAFRKSLLWNELAEKAPTSPTAVLGMLDIVNSQPGLASNAMKNSLKLFIASIRSAVRAMTAADAWTFLQTLAGKVEAREELAPISLEATKSAELLAAAAPDAAIEFLQRFPDGPDPFPVDVILGLGNGLAANDDVLIDYRGIPAHIGTFLIANSASFSAGLARRIRRGETPASDIVPYLQVGDSTWHEVAIIQLLFEIDSREFAPLLPYILKRSSSDSLVDQILRIVDQTKLAFPEFDDALVDAIRDDNTMSEVRDFVAYNVRRDNADRFIEETIRLVPSDVEWLRGVQGPRSAKLLASVIAKQNDRAMIEAQRDANTRRAMLEILSKDVSVSATEIARILVLGAASIDELLDFGDATFDLLPKESLRLDLVNAMLERGLLEADPNDQRVEFLANKYFDEVGARRLVRWSVGDDVSTPRLAANLYILTRLSDAQRRLLADYVDDLSYRLSRQGSGALSEDVCSAWADLLWNAKTVAPTVYLKAATTSMSATIYLTRSPVGEVVAAAFPAVYQELVSRDDDLDTSLLGLFFAVPRMLVSDWDRAKPARHRLVDAFMNSNWHPSYLLLAAARAGIVDRICLRVTRQKGGAKFLDRAIADLQRLTPEQIALIRRGLEQFSGSDLNNEWD